MINHKKLVPLYLGLAIAIGIFIGGKLDFADSNDRLFTSNSKKDKLNRLIDYIDHEYVDEVDTDSIVDVTVNRILDNLDPHSTYIPKENLQEVTENMKGDFVGIGVSFYTHKDTVTVIRALDGGPSKKAGIQGGDKILLANGEPIYGPLWTNEAVVNRLKGEKGSEVELTVLRPGENELIKFDIKRGEVPIKSLEAAYMLNEKLGYIKINRFAESTYKEFKKGLNTLINDGAKELVLDLRDNPGGFLGIAELISDEFLEDNKLILFTKNKKGRVEKSYATSKGDFEQGHVYVLLNENSASASEIIAGALQDNDKGTIVGRRSYGKGLVQREMALGDGSAVRLTISRYYTPTGRSIQRSYENGNRDYFDDYYKRLESGELTSASKIEVADSLKFKTPKGKVVYGGGGIIPDVFVPINTRMENETVRRIVASNIMSNFVFEELESDRALFKELLEDDFLINFSISDEILVKFSAYLNAKARYRIPFDAYNKEIKLHLKANYAEQLFGEQASVRVLNSDDQMLNKVFELSEL